MKLIEARPLLRAFYILFTAVLISNVPESSTWADENQKALGLKAMPEADFDDCGLGGKLSGVFPPELLKKITHRRLEAVPASDSRILEPIPDGFSNEEILAELKSVAGEPFLERNGYSIYLAKGSQIPKALDELGRLREITFRAVGEGTGKPRDIDDNFDPYYYHLIAWDKKNGYVSGAYRFALVPEILSTRGPRGLYLLDQFHISNSLLGVLQEDTIEVSRSFVRVESQRSLTLFLLLKSISKYMVLHPQYRHLWGAVSISNEYTDVSKQLMTEFLAQNYPHPHSTNVRPVIPPNFSTSLSLAEIQALVGGTQSLDQLQDLVRFAENNDKAKLPPLIPIYIGIGVRFLGFNYDPSFNTVDGLILADVPLLTPEVRKKFMEEDGSKIFMDYWTPRLSAGGR